MLGPETLIVIGGVLLFLSTSRRPMPKAVRRFTSMLERR
jgi:hypothetical protein